MSQETATPPEVLCVGSAPRRRLSPPWCYYGGKWRLAPRYPAPLHARIVEPFAGAAGYALRYHTHRVLLVDRDEAVVATWRYLLAVGVPELLALPDVPPGATVDDVRCAPEARLLIGWWLNKGSSSPCKRPSAWARSGLRPDSFWGAAVRARLARLVEKVRHWQVRLGDYREVQNEPATWFVDPPYSGPAGRFYRCGNAELDYSELARWCFERQGQVIVCESEGADWLPFRPLGGNAKPTPGKQRRPRPVEVVWRTP